MAYPIIHNGDYAEFEAEWAASGKPDSERPDWPLPSFDARASGKVSATWLNWPQSRALEQGTQQ